MKKYIVVFVCNAHGIGCSEETIEKAVNNKVDGGYVPTGGVTYSCLDDGRHRFYQAMVLKDVPEA